jgi:hypothetical protein
MLSSWFLRVLEEWEDVSVALEAAWLARCVGVGNSDANVGGRDDTRMCIIHKSVHQI